MDRIVRRDVELAFSADEVPRHWYGGDAFLTTFWSSFSLLLPEGERFFVDSVKHYRAQISDPALVRNVEGFIGQEAMHGRAHRAFNAMLMEQGYSMVPALEEQLRRLLDLGRRVLSHEAQLAVTCALEHFTSMMGQQLLEESAQSDAIDDRVRMLWLWHALEETEHKAVAYDLYASVGGSYATRIGIMLLASTIFVLEMVNVHVRLMRADGTFSLRRVLRGLDYMWVRPGWFRRLIRPYLDYFRPGFHPLERDTRSLEEGWRAALFGS